MNLDRRMNTIRLLKRALSAGIKVSLAVDLNQAAESLVVESPAVEIFGKRT
jgi:hypothetical protein